MCGRVCDPVFICWVYYISREEWLVIYIGEALASVHNGCKVTHVKWREHLIRSKGWTQKCWMIKSSGLFFNVRKQLKIGTINRDTYVWRMVILHWAFFVPTYAHCASYLSWKWATTPQIKELSVVQEGVSYLDHAWKCKLLTHNSPEDCEIKNPLNVVGQVMEEIENDTR